MKSKPIAAAASRPNASCTSTGNCGARQRQCPAGGRWRIWPPPAAPVARAARPARGRRWPSVPPARSRPARRRRDIADSRAPRPAGASGRRSFPAAAGKRGNRRLCRACCQACCPSTAVRANSSTSRCGSFIFLSTRRFKRRIVTAASLDRLLASGPVGQFRHVGDELRIGPRWWIRAGDGRQLLGPIGPGGRAATSSARPNPGPPRPSSTPRSGGRADKLAVRVLPQFWKWQSLEPQVCLRFAGTCC